MSDREEETNRTFWYLAAISLCWSLIFAAIRKLGWGVDWWVVTAPIWAPLLVAATGAILIMSIEGDE